MLLFLNFKSIVMFSLLFLVINDVFDYRSAILIKGLKALRHIFLSVGKTNLTFKAYAALT